MGASRSTIWRHVNSAREKITNAVLEIGEVVYEIVWSENLISAHVRAENSENVERMGFQVCTKLCGQGLPDSVQRCGERKASPLLRNAMSNCRT